MSEINVSHLSFSYPGRYEKVFDDTSFIINTDWKLGIIGRNGKGKTTFLRILNGELEYEGHISKNVDIDYFPFEINDYSKNTLDIIKEIATQAEDWEIIKELNLLETDLDILYRPFETLSGGEQVKVLLVALFLKANNFLLIDEPTNHLDTNSRETIANYLKSKKGFILVSHDRELLDKVVDHIISINNTTIDVQAGNYTSWKQNKAYKDNFEMSQNEKLEKDISRLKVAAADTNKWSNDIEKAKIGTHEFDRGHVGHQSAKMMKRSKSIERRINKEIDEKSNLLNDVDRQDLLVIKPLDTKRNKLIVADKLSIAYGENVVLESISFEINKGDRVCFKGKNGSGKSTLLKAILGETDFQIKSGDLSVASELKISYVSQFTNDLKGSLREYAEENKINESIFKAMLTKMGFSKEEFDKKIENLSEGQKKKVLLAKSITENADIYVWDEPLNFIDIQTREQIEEMILKYMPTLIFVEHDNTFVNKIATKVIEL
jgi:lincosamide and streptogramin A transport system ATP-binding/permease protein